MSETTRARVHLRAAHGYAITGDAAACQRHLDAVTPLAKPVDSTGAVTANRLRAYEASCWLWMRRPQEAIGLYESALRGWPGDQMRDAGLHQARLAISCAAFSEHDRARAEGSKALAIFKLTQSVTAARELKRLRPMLNAAN